jgi:hypothetical protein
MRRGKYKVRTLNKDAHIGIDRFPNFSASGSVTGMKNFYYGLDSLLVRHGAYIYNVTSEPEIYWEHSH